MHIQPVWSPWCGSEWLGACVRQRGCIGAMGGSASTVAMTRPEDARESDLRRSSIYKAMDASDGEYGTTRGVRGSSSGVGV